VTTPMNFPDPGSEPEITSQEPRSWTSRNGRALAAGTAVLLLTGATIGIAEAAASPAGSAASPASAPATSPTSPTSPSTSPTSPGTAPKRVIPGWGPGGRFGIRGLGPAAGPAIHGENTVPDGKGGYQTIDDQTGTVSAVSTTSITVKSADGFTKSYTVTADTVVDAKRDGISSIKTGDTVYLSATVTNGTATATSVTDTSLVKTARPGVPNTTMVPGDPNAKISDPYAWYGTTRA
jgi:hypothetical protein